MSPLLLLSLGVLAATVDVTPATVVVHDAAHHGDVSLDEIHWSSTLLVEVPRGATLVRVPLARPLPPDVRLSVDGSREVDVERDERGRAVAVVASVSALRASETHPLALQREVRLRARQPLPRSSDVVLHAPLPAGQGVQRVTLAGATPLRFLVDDALGIERRIGRSVGVDVSRDERRRVDRWLPHVGPERGERMYLRIGPAVVEQGLCGTLERAPAQRTEVGLAAGLVFALLVGGGAWLYRRAARQAELERVDALLEEEFRALG